MLEEQLKILRRRFKAPLVPAEHSHLTTLRRELEEYFAGTRHTFAVPVNGMNRVAIVIPCHRVLNKNGELGGYGGGLWRKRRLLDIEGIGTRSGQTRSAAVLRTVQA
jgi:AraC family transcriptional regulator of adaptative response/methylated-DNA-[protein]-cysteine methyltransferase